MNETHRKKISYALKGKKHSATHNLKVSFALKGKRKSNAHKKSISEGLKKYYENKKKNLIKNEK